MSPELDQVVAIIKLAAQQCFIQDAHTARTYKDDGSFVTLTDEKLQHTIEAALHKAYPSVRLLGEEMTRKQQAALLEEAETGLWILDPLDGTTNFASSFPVYGVSAAFVKGGHCQLAVVYDPVRDECFSAQKGKGAWLNDQPLVRSKVGKLGDCIANVDYKRLTSDMASQLVKCPPYRSQRNLGSSVLEWCWLAADRFQVYLHGGQQLWDYAAAQLILDEAGGEASSMYGEPICANKLTKQSVVAAASPELYSAWYRWVEDQIRISGGSL